jgi:hypothetical protein
VHRGIHQESLQNPTKLKEMQWAVVDWNRTQIVWSAINGTGGELC